LVVAVCSQAVDGKATEAALAAVAEALGVKRRDIRLLSGATSRDKLIEIEGDVTEIGAAIERLLSV
jgi:uncharacterized protein YggU (UPF0235/DUF167 family)